MDRSKNNEKSAKSNVKPQTSKGDQRSNNNKRGSVDSANSDTDANDVYFIIPRTVYVLYGPYMYNGIMDYRTERLQGLKTFLEKLGVTVELKPALDHYNLVRIWFLEELIFSCKITSLIHGGDGELDPICWEAAATLEKFIKKVLKGLRQSRPIGPEELKKPFCPCFHQAEEKRPNKPAIKNHQWALTGEDGE